jgi:ketosteroid isomerase-like protein
MFKAAAPGTLAATSIPAEGEPQMSTTSETPALAIDIAAARERNEAIWNEASALLFAKRIDEFVAFWQEDARYEVAYPIPGMPAVLEGREMLAEALTGLLSAAERVDVHDIRFHQTDDPNVAFVEERWDVDLTGGARYENTVVIRVTFRDGLIAAILEYYGERAHTELIQRLTAGV